MTNKKSILLFLLLAIAIASKAQTYLTDVYKPTDSYLYKAYPTKGSDVMKIAIYKYKGGFTLQSGKGGLISGTKAGFVVFDLNESYDKISFVVGPDNPNSASDEYNVILTMKADGKRVLDKVIWDHDAPQECVVDIKGAKQLRFDMPKGSTNLAFGAVKLWKSGQEYKPSANPLRSVPTNDRVQLVGQLYPHFIRHSGWVNPITSQEVNGIEKVPSIKINQVEYKTGLQFTANQAFVGNNEAWAYFWLQKKYSKISFIIGPRDNQSTMATGWLTIKGDGKILYEKRLKERDLAEMVVLDVEGINQLSFHSIDELHRLMGGIVFGVVNIFAYPTDYDMSLLPKAGEVNASKSKVSQLPDVCRLVSNIEPYSVQGIVNYQNSVFRGESEYITFSMGGEKFDEGFVLTSGATLLGEDISSYYKFDLAGEFDYMTFTVGALTNRRVMSDDNIRIYVDDKVVLDTVIHCTWPNQHFTIPLNKCRTVMFAKPGTGSDTQPYFGFGDITLYRGEVVANNLYEHPKPECPDSADLIDLCKRPYFHFVGRYLSRMTNFDFNDCFHNGGSQRRYFNMKDGTKIYKGVMLETNIPFAFENVTFMDLAFMFLTGAGGEISSSNVSAATGVSAGASSLPITMLNLSKEAREKGERVQDRAKANNLNLGVLSLFGPGGYQSSAAAFNIYGEYDTCTFTVANKSVFVDPYEEILGGVTGEKAKAPPVRLDVFADQVKVGEFMLTDDMQPTTYTVPVNKSTQLMFWLECGDVRSGQYVLYDMSVKKNKKQE